MKLIALKDIEDESVFYKGTRFRQYNIGLNVNKKENDFYEYMLAELPTKQNFMVLICVEGYKSGSVLALVKTLEDPYNLAVNAKAIKYSMGIKNIYLKKE